MSEEPGLRLIDGNGEVVRYEDNPLAVELEMVKRELSGYRMRLATAEKKLRNLEEVDPDSEDILVVGNYHSKRAVETGWWSRKPAFKPGVPGWGAVSARLKDPEYDVGYCLVAIDGAFMQPKWEGKRPLKREWLTCESIFRAGNIEKHYERAVDPTMVRVAAWMDLAKLCRSADATFLAETCECGHKRLEHSVLRMDGPLQGWVPCQATDCVCMDFEDAA